MSANGRQARAEAPAMEFHPAANLFPLLEGEEFQDLCDDVRARGLLDPVVRHEGKILDGRNRYRACQEAGVPVRFVDWDGEGGTPLAFVASKNLHRRHLTASQRAMLAADALPQFEEAARERHRAGSARGGKGSKARESIPAPPRKRARDDAARAFRVNPRYIQDAKRIKDKVASGELPQDVEDEVRSGAVSLPQAERQGSPAPRDPTATLVSTQGGRGPCLTDAGRPVASEYAARIASVLQVIRDHADHPQLEAELRAQFEEDEPTFRRLFVRASQLSMKAQAVFRSTP